VNPGGRKDAPPLARFTACSPAAAQDDSTSLLSTVPEIRVNAIGLLDHRVKTFHM
jgi:hypothetical protein